MEVWRLGTREREEVQRLNGGREGRRRRRWKARGEMKTGEVMALERYGNALMLSIGKDGVYTYMYMDCQDVDDDIPTHHMHITQTIFHRCQSVRERMVKPV